MSQSVLANTDVGALLSGVMDAGDRNGVAWLALPTDAQTLTLEHVRGEQTQSLQGLRVPVGWGVTGKVALSGRVQYVQDYFDTDSITRAFDHQVSAEGIRRMLAVPLQQETGTPGHRGVVTLGLRSSGTLSDQLIDRIVEASRARLPGSRSPADAHAPVAAEAEQVLTDIRAQLISLRERSADPDVRDLLRQVEAAVEDTTRRVRGTRSETSRGTDALPRLTCREAQILVLIADGLTNAAIGHRLGLTANTVKTYWQTAMRKLGVCNRAEAIHLAHALGLLA